MVKKEKKTRLELTDLIAAEIQKRSNSGAVKYFGVSAAEVPPHHANWDASFIRTTAYPNPPTELSKVVGELKKQFDCIWPQVFR